LYCGPVQTEMERWGDRGWHSTARGNSPEKKQQTGQEQSPDRSRSPLFSVVIIGDPRRTRTYNHLIKESDESCSTVVHRRPICRISSGVFSSTILLRPPPSVDVRWLRCQKRCRTGRMFNPDGWGWHHCRIIAFPLSTSPASSSSCRQAQRRCLRCLPLEKHPRLPPQVRPPRDRTFGISSPLQCFACADSLNGSVAATDRRVSVGNPPFPSTEAESSATALIVRCRIRPGPGDPPSPRRRPYGAERPPRLARCPDPIQDGPRRSRDVRRSHPILFRSWRTR